MTGRGACLGKGAKPCLYGLWFLDKMLERGLTYCLLVEGESDTQTAVAQDPMLGVPGLARCGPNGFQTKSFERLYLIDEGDMGGETFIRKTYAALVKGGYTGPVYRVRLPGVKDISELHLTSQKDLVANAYDK